MRTPVPPIAHAGLTAVLFLTAACGGGRVTMPGSVAGGSEPALRVRVQGRVTTIPLERYVLGASLSEITPAGEPADVAARIYEVQSIIARTYAVSHQRRHAAEGFDLCDTTHCQVYEPDRLRTSSFARVAEAAVQRTRGRTLRVAGRAIEALFHADCGGHTTTPAAAWGGTNHAYLPAREDRVPGLTHRTWVFEATTAEWRTLLNGDARTSVGAVLTTIEVGATGPGERVTAVRLDGARDRTVSGEILRAVVAAARGARSVMSTRFTVHRTPAGFRLVGSGFGHGVGLCQVGTIARARRGDRPADILGHYFPGAELR